MDYKFDTSVEVLKFNILKEIAKAVYAGKLDQEEKKIPLIISPGPKSKYRDSLEVERSIICERIKIIKGNGFENKNVIQVIPLACDHCPSTGYVITSLCRGCIGHACANICPRKAIWIDDNHHAHIDKQKCINCGLCAKACPYGVILNFVRPCIKACAINAISIDKNGSAKIDDSKCVNCGACLQKCPFGAINDVSQMVSVIETIKNNSKSVHPKKIYAIVAPSIASQFIGMSVNKIAEAIVNLGFDKVVEAALGADMVAWEEGQDLVKKAILTSSCCPAFVSYIKKFHPEIKDKISTALSPMAQIAKVIKQKNPDSIICFIGPCTAKKMEIRLDSVKKYVDYALTFVELRAMIAAKNIDLVNLKGIALDDATAFGRGFAACGGLSNAVVEVLKEIGETKFKLCAQQCSGMKQCVDAITNLANGKSNYNFIEGMACDGGCVNGAGSLTHNALVSKALVGMHGKTAKEKNVADVTKKYIDE